MAINWSEYSATVAIPALRSVALLDEADTRERARRQGASRGALGDARWAALCALQREAEGHVELMRRAGALLMLVWPAEELTDGKQGKKASAAAGTRRGAAATARGGVERACVGAGDGDTTGDLFKDGGR